MPRTATPKTENSNGTSASNVTQGNEPSAGKQPFFDRLKEMPETAWDTHQVYVYRRWPRINKSDSPHYIGVVRQAIDEPWLLENFGSGRYTLRLNNPRKTIDTYVCEVHALDKPPKLDVSELIDCPENVRFHELWPTLKPAASTPTAPGSSSDSGAVSEMSRLLGKLIDQKQPSGESDKLKDVLVTWALQQTAKEKDAQGPTQIAGLLKELKSLMPAAPPPPPAGPDPLAILDRVLSITGKLQPQPTAAEKDPFDAVGKVLELMDRIRPSEGRAFSGESTWEKAGAMISNILAPAMQPLGMALANKWMGAPGMPAHMQPPSATITRVPHLADAPGALPPAQSPGQAAPPDVDPAVQQLAAFLPQFVNPIVNFINMNRTGAEFADFVTDGYGEIVYQQIRQLTKEQLLQAMSITPGLDGLVQQVPARMAQFVDEFLNPETADVEPETAAPEAA